MISISNASDKKTLKPKSYFQCETNMFYLELNVISTTLLCLFSNRCEKTTESIGTAEGLRRASSMEEGYHKPSVLVGLFDTKWRWGHHVGKIPLHAEPCYQQAWRPQWPPRSWPLCTWGNRTTGMAKRGQVIFLYSWQLYQRIQSMKITCKPPKRLIGMMWF